MVTGFFKTECGGCHVTIDRCSGKKSFKVRVFLMLFFGFTSYFTLSICNWLSVVFGPIMLCLGIF